MNTYLCPIDDMNLDSPFIFSVTSNSMNDAKDKIEEKLRYDYDCKLTGSWFDFVKEMAKQDVYIGSVYDKDEF